MDLPASHGADDTISGIPRYRTEDPNMASQGRAIGDMVTGREYNGDHEVSTM